MQSILSPDEYTLFEASLTQAPFTSIRYNTRKAYTPFEGAKPIPWCPSGRYLPERPYFHMDPAHHAGAYYVQEASSMVLDHIIRELALDQAPLLAIDLCAAPGGKSTLLLHALHPQSLLLANEPIKSRALILKENLEKWGHPSSVVVQNDPEHLAALGGIAQLVLVDAPCSGEGMFRKSPESRLEWNEQSPNNCALRQRRILEHATQLVAQDGYLIYSTCTFSPEENEHNARWLQQELGLAPVRIAPPSVWGLVTDDLPVPHLHCYPHRVQGEGMFWSVFSKRESILPARKAKKQPIMPKTKEILPVLHRIMEWDDDMEVYQHVDYLYTLPKKWKESYSMIFSACHILKPGLELGKWLGNEIIPSHALALNTHLKIRSDFWEVDKQRALSYLKKEEYVMNPTEANTSNGWKLLRYHGLNLGWVKKIGNRTNNYYPKEYRILQELN